MPAGLQYTGATEKEKTSTKQFCQNFTFESRHQTWSSWKPTACVLEEPGKVPLVKTSEPEMKQLNIPSLLLLQIVHIPSPSSKGIGWQPEKSVLTVRHGFVLQES